MALKTDFEPKSLPNTASKKNHKSYECKVIKKAS